MRVPRTFDDTERTQNEASQAGATALLRKPFGAAALILALSRYLSIGDNDLRGIYDDAVRASGRNVLVREQDQAFEPRAAQCGKVLQDIQPAGLPKAVRGR
jgi:hypothetical protein